MHHNMVSQKMQILNVISKFKIFLMQKISKFNIFKCIFQFLHPHSNFKFRRKKENLILDFINNFLIWCACSV